LDGGAGHDKLYGGAGDDQLLGGSGNDRLYGGTGDDLLLGGTGNDRLSGNEGQDRLDGGSGNDLVDGGPDADRMTGGDGDDVLVVDHLHDVALENARGPDGGGDDVLQIGDGFADHLPAGVDSVTFVFSSELGAALPGEAASYRQQVGLEIEHVTLTGDADHDVIGDAGDNRIFGNSGDNALFGGGGDDLLKGGAGSDHLEGGSGRDRLDGGEGDDILAGGSGADKLYGGDGDDILEGGRGADLLYGQDGDDTYSIGLSDSAMDWISDDAGRNQLTIEDGAGHLVETAVAGKDLYVIVDKNPIAVVDDWLGNEDAFDGIDTGKGTRSIDDLMATNADAGPSLTGQAAGSSANGAAHDLLDPWLTRPSLQGGAGSDQLAGTSAPDWLSGHAGDDQLRGGGGRDVLEGGAGSDILEGGGGADRYLFKAGEAGWDVIRDTEGSNAAVLDGFAKAKLNGVVVGKNLVVVANNSPVFTFEDYVGNEQAFASATNWSRARICSLEPIAGAGAARGSRSGPRPSAVAYANRSGSSGAEPAMTAGSSAAAGGRTWLM
jgi:Ca2+-binding RTX toxin-like protein